MNTDDSHYRSCILKLNETDFPELFGENKKINLSVLADEEYFDRKLGKIDSVDILGLPTENINPFRFSEEDCEEANIKIAKAFKESFCSKNKKTAGVIGASEMPIDPFSENSFTELISAYDKQVNSLSEYVDLFIIYGVSSMSDMRAALFACKKRKKPVFVMVDFNNEEEISGISALGGLITCQETGAAAFGLICSDPDDYREALAEIHGYAKIPLIADFSEENADIADDFGFEYFSLGLNRVEPAERLKKEKNAETGEKTPLDDFFVFTHYGSVFFLEPDTTEISEPISCQPDMQEIISEACKTSCDVLCVEINSNDDAIDFAHNAHMSSLPVMFLSENILALKMALLLYQGTALIDSSTLIPKNELEKMCRKYGAVVY